MNEQVQRCKLISDRANARSRSLLDDYTLMKLDSTVERIILECEEQAGEGSFYLNASINTNEVPGFYVERKLFFESVKDALRAEGFKFPASCLSQNKRDHYRFLVYWGDKDELNVNWRGR